MKKPVRQPVKIQTDEFTNNDEYGKFAVTKLKVGRYPHKICVDVCTRNRRDTNVLARRIKVVLKALV